MSWFKKKTTYPPLTSPLKESSQFIRLKCGCSYYWVRKTNQTILHPHSECPESHRAEIAENVSREDWDNLVKVNNLLGPQQEINHRFVASSGYLPINIINQGGNTP